MKSSLLGSTSDSNINKYSTINKIPLIALNFTEGTDKKTHSPPTSETTIIAPKVKDRTHNVTEKVTQVSQEVLLLFGIALSSGPEAHHVVTSAVVNKRTIYANTHPHKGQAIGMNSFRPVDFSVETPLRCEHFLTASIGKSIIHVLKTGECTEMNRKTCCPRPHSSTIFCHRRALSLFVCHCLQSQKQGTAWPSRTH